MYKKSLHIIKSLHILRPLQSAESDVYCNEYCGLCGPPNQTFQSTCCTQKVYTCEYRSLPPRHFRLHKKFTLVNTVASSVEWTRHFRLNNEFTLHQWILQPLLVCFFTPNQPFQLNIRTKHNPSDHKSKSFHGSRHFAVIVWRGFGENEVDWARKAEICRLET